MNKFLYIVLLTVFFSCDNKKEGKAFEIEGTIKNTTAKTIYLEENVPGGQLTIIDSAAIKDGKFQLKTTSNEESFYQLRLEGKMTPFALLINDVPQIKVQADLNNATQPYTVEGSAASQALISFDKTIYDQGMKLFAAGSIRDSLQNARAADSIITIEHRRVEQLVDSLKSFAKNFLSKSNSPVFTMYALSSFQNTSANLGIQGFTQTEAAEIINTAATKFPAHTALQNVKRNLPAVNSRKESQPVTKATDFVQPGIDGAPVSLSSFKGKYVLLDFWASWCKPCRIDNPNVVKAYQEFKDKNFTVFGVSLDLDKEDWLKAIQQDGLTWTHASDLKHWSNEAAVLYGVQSIPANFLIGPEGNIVAQDLHGEEIANTLRKFIK